MIELSGDSNSQPSLQDELKRIRRCHRWRWGGQHFDEVGARCPSRSRLPSLRVALQLPSPMLEQERLRVGLLKY